MSVSVETLNKSFGRGDVLTFSLGVGSLAVARLRLPSGASASIYLHGAHVTSFINDAGQDVIFMSSKAAFTPTSAIRGGIPVIFPQFGPFPLPGLKALPQHGFARSSNDWQVVETSATSSEVSITLELKDTETSRKIWNNAFVFRLTTILTAAACPSRLIQRMNVTNANAQGDLDFTTALHSYFTVNDVKRVGLQGFQGLTYLDRVDGGKEKSEANSTVSFAGEVDRIYLNAPNVLTITEAGQAAVEVVKDGFKDSVVWNVGQEKGKAMADLGEGEWQKYACLEVAVVKEPVHLKPGESWSACQTIRSTSITDSKL